MRRPRLQEVRKKTSLYYANPQRKSNITRQEGRGWTKTLTCVKQIKILRWLPRPSEETEFLTFEFPQTQINFNFRKVVRRIRLRKLAAMYSNRKSSLSNPPLRCTHKRCSRQSRTRSAARSTNLGTQSPVSETHCQTESTKVAHSEWLMLFKLPMIWN